MPSQITSCPDITIPSGDTVSNIVRAKEVYGDAVGIMLYAPAVLTETCVIEVTHDREATTLSTFVTLQDGSPLTDVAPPTAGKAIPYFNLATAAAFRIKAGSAVGADRTFKMTKQDEPY
jgi:hypothetical protein